jgi:signal transduction histidine kinase
LFDAKAKEITFYALWEDGKLLRGDSIPKDKRHISNGKSIMLQVATTGEAHLASDFESDPHYKKWYSETRSELGIPLKDVNKNVIGVLDLESKRLQAFTNADESFCMGLANIIAVILEKSNLLSISQRLNRQLELLHGVVGEQDVQTVLTNVLNALNEVGGEGTSSSINLYDEVGDSFYSILTVGEHADALQMPPRPNGTCRYALKNRTSLYIDDVKNPPPDLPTIRDEAVRGGVKSYAVLPLFRNVNTLGVLLVHKMSQVSFSQDFKQLLATFANQAAIAIENARAYENLKELDRKKTEFLSTVSHELRTPLTSVQSCIENLLSGMYGYLNEKQLSRLDIALAGAREESRLIANLLDLARIQEGRTTLDLVRGDICKIIHDVTGVFRYDAGQKNITIKEEIPVEEKLEVIIDAGKIKQVITNLVSNALKFTPEKGVITISAHCLDEQVEVSVKDNGIGIPEVEFKKIFDRFYQVDSSLTRKVGGTGIGLNIAKEYVEMHGGRIWVESSKVGEGSTFMFTLPVK